MIDIKQAIQSSGWGEYKKVTRDFLDPSAPSTIIIRGKTGKKRKCCAVKLKNLSEQIKAEIKRGKILMLLGTGQQKIDH